MESPELPEGAGELLDSWLMLLEKMVNVKTMLETPHSLPAKPTGKKLYLQCAVKLKAS